MRAELAWLNEIDIAPPHLLDWNPDQAVTMVVTESSTTATSSRQSSWWPVPEEVVVTPGVWTIRGPSAAASPSVPGRADRDRLTRAGLSAAAA